MRKVKEERQILMGDGAIAMNYSKENAMSILCQAMFDETIRLRKCRNMRERENIRQFLRAIYLLFLEENRHSEC